MKFHFKSFALTFAAMTALSSVSTVAPAMAQDLTEAKIREVLLRNPDIVMAALMKAQENERKLQQDQLAAATRPISEQLLKGDRQVASIGAAKGTPVIEFFDYNCGFCKKFHGETATPLLAEGKTKLILVHTPILGPGSLRLAELAAAANLQGKFEGAHDFLIKHSAKTVDEADKLVPDLVAAAKLDRAKFDRALADGSAKKQVEYNFALAQRAGVQGTPMILVNGKAVPGAIPLEPLKQMMN